MLLRKIILIFGLAASALPALANDMGTLLGAKRLIEKGNFNQAFQILRGFDNPAYADQFENVASIFVKKHPNLSRLHNQALAERMRWLDQNSN